MMKEPRSGLLFVFYAPFWIIEAELPLEKQVGPKGIRGNGVASGPIWTALQVSGGVPVKKVTRSCSWTALRRPGQPAELASIYVQLAASDASSATGQVYRASGGAGQP